MGLYEIVAIVVKALAPAVVVVDGVVIVIAVIYASLRAWRLDEGDVDKNV